MKVFNLTKTSKYLFLLGAVFLANACKELDKIDYIQFKANFTMPNLAREQETVFLQPSDGAEISTNNTQRAGTANAQEFSWNFGDNETSQEKLPSHIYQKFGTYSVKLKTKMQKQQGVIADSITKNITILPKLNTPNSNSTFSYGGANRDEVIYDVLPIIDNSGYWLVGRRNINDIWINKVGNDFKSKPGFPKTIEPFTNALISPKSIETTTDGGIIMVGEIQNTPQDRDAFILKLEADGAEDWSEVVASLKDEYYVGVFQNKQGNYTAIGTSYSGSNNDINIISDIYNATTGNKINSILSIVSACKCKAGSIYKLPDAGGIEDAFVVAGTTRNNVPAIIYATNNGTVSTFSLLANNDNDNFKGEGLTVLGLSDGKFALAGYLNNTTNSTQKDAFIAKFDRIGQTAAWRVRFKMYSDEFQTIMEDANKDIIAIGNHNNPLSDNDIFLAKFDSNTGKNLQYKTFGTINDERAYQAIYTTQNKILLVGLQKSTETIPFRNNGFLMLLNENWE